MRLLFTGSLVLATLLSACTDKAPQAAAPAPEPSAPAPAAAAPAVEPAATPDALNGATKLLGQWNGPEGTYLLVAGTSGKYALTIANLDGPRTFQGTAAGDAITFERDGKQHTIRATDGATTGMKWLADKKNCVTIDTGEGYCRD